MISSEYPSRSGVQGDLENESYGPLYLIAEIEWKLCLNIVPHARTHAHTHTHTLTDLHTYTLTHTLTRTHSDTEAARTHAGRTHAARLEVI